MVATAIFFTAALGQASSWYAETPGQVRQLTPNASGEVVATMSLPGNILIYRQRDRYTMRPQPADWQKTALQLEIMVEGETPVRGSIFFKDKDGLWFQSSDRAFSPGSWQRCRVDLTRDGGELYGVGHHAVWNSSYALNALQFGLSLYSGASGPPGACRVRCRNWQFVGQRRLPALRVVDWRMPASGGVYRRTESTFELSREYFNPFDPDEIAVDVEAVAPSGQSIVFPAFYTRNFLRRRHFTREILLPDGRAHWAFRFTPREAGTYRFRLKLTDHSAGNAESLTTPWQSMTVTPSAARGFIRISPTDHRYYEFTTGEFFFPIGLNVHTNIDRRSEKAFSFGYLPDRGSYDYEEYLDAIAAAGINTVEIWMASWTNALEWNSSRLYYHGLGRYNLAHAWRLDHILDYARDRRVYVHLVLDNHGKMSAHSDQEWEDSPFNRNNAFAVANGGFLNEPKEFFTDPEAIRLNRQRNRYIAARWGAQTNIFAIELWSEIDLVTGHQELYDSGRIIDWNVNTARELKQLDQGRHIISTHVCGDYQHNLNFRRYYDGHPEMEHIIGDAYRKPEIHFVDQLQRQVDHLAEFNRPLLITEYGGTSSGSEAEYVIGDIHTGQWAAFFLGQAGTPFLWWHDFVHRNRLYPHYYGVSRYLADIDPRGKNLLRRPVHFPPFPLGIPRYFHAVVAEELQLPGYFPPLLAPAGDFSELRGLTVGNRNEVYGWIFFYHRVWHYPSAPDSLTPTGRLPLRLPWELQPGHYAMEFFDTMTGKCRQRTEFTVRDGKLPVFTMPPFTIDIAFKLRRQGPVPAPTPGN
ncbi:MAG: DUF5060 domain-containing protein [Victivallales bacterium]|nr:DUF5060 domain-containing protein [Victivallales bacterium]